MNMETIIRVPLNDSVFNSFLFFINQTGKDEYVVKRLDALENLTAFLTETERKVIEGEKWINYIIFYRSTD